MSDSPEIPGFKAGFVVLAGRPNVGKSTLLNRILETKLTIVSPKPQTTRHKILGILNGPSYQVCFLDTPGLMQNPKDRLQDALARTARIAAHNDADILVLLVEPSVPKSEDLIDFENLRDSGLPLIVGINKTDAVPPEKIEKTAAAYAALSPSEIVRFSALKGDGVRTLLDAIMRLLPESPAFYEQGRLSDRWERFFAAEIIREKVFELFKEEIPHATAVAIDSFRELKGSPDEIAATLYVERETQKGIMIGKKGVMIRRLNDISENALRVFLDRPVYLDLRVKVRKNWKKDSRSLKEFGYIP